MENLRTGFAQAVIVFNQDGMGHGDESLRLKLADNYLRALAEAGSPPRAILLYAAGVKLATRDSACRDSLSRVAALGSKVIVCRTCLSQYGLLDAVPESDIGNMLMIMEEQAAATKVITL